MPARAGATIGNSSRRGVRAADPDSVVERAVVFRGRGPLTWASSATAWNAASMAPRILRVVSPAFVLRPRRRRRRGVGRRGRRGQRRDRHAARRPAGRGCREPDGRAAGSTTSARHAIAAGPASAAATTAHSSPSPPTMRPRPQSPPRSPASTGPTRRPGSTPAAPRRTDDAPLQDASRPAAQLLGARRHHAADPLGGRRRPQCTRTPTSSTGRTRPRRARCSCPTSPSAASCSFSCLPSSSAARPSRRRTSAAGRSPACSPATVSRRPISTRRRGARPATARCSASPARQPSPPPPRSRCASTRGYRIRTIRRTRRPARARCAPPTRPPAPHRVNVFGRDELAQMRRWRLRFDEAAPSSNPVRDALGFLSVSAKPRARFAIRTMSVDHSGS
jgi:hypothetical protein